jgi:hypothetical protein
MQPVASRYIDRATDVYREAIFPEVSGPGLQENMDLYTHSPTRLHGVVLN